MIKRILLILLVLGPMSGLYAQTLTVTGRVTDAEKGNTLPAVTVRIGTQQTVSRSDGTFELQGITPGDAVIDFALYGYEELTMQIKVNTTVDLGTIAMNPSAVSDLNSGLAEINLGNLDADDGSRDQNISGLLSSSNDVFVSRASFTFSSAYFRMRGYDNDLNTTYIGNSPVNDAENGRTTWAIWGGLNDATRNKVSVSGLAPSSFSFGNLGGASNIITRASQQREQTKLTYSAANRTYTNRFQLTHSTGMMDNGWALTLSASRRWGQEGYVDGTHYDAYAWFLGLEKKLSDKHTLGFTALDAPVRRGMQGGSTQEVYDLTDNNYYNPNWGYQKDEKRNAKERIMNQPLLILNDYWNVNKNTQVTSALSYLFGETGTTALNWYNSADPRPDYYRYLPSWYPSTDYDPSIAAQITEDWQNDPSVNQIDWNKLYQTNYLANTEGKQARYIIENRHNDQSQVNLLSVINHEVNENIKVDGGVELSSFTGSYYKELDDLLGGKYWVDIDQFAERDFPGNDSTAQSDLNNPYRIVKVGDKFGYNYKLHQNSGNIWTVARFSTQKLDYYGGLQLSYTSFWREGLMKTGLHPENSFGNSEKQNFFDYALKGGATYKATGRHFIEANIAYMTRAPYMRNSYLSPRTRDDVTPGLKSEKIFSGELSYHLRAPMVKARITAYHTIFTDQSEITSFYHDDYRTLVNYVMYNINKTHQGIEAGAEVKLSSAFSALFAANLGNYRYTNRPTATVSFDNGSQPDTTETIYCKYFYVSGTPQTAGSLGLKYAGPDYLFIEANVNYYDKMYLDFNPERRTTLAIENLGEGDPLISLITKQEKLPSGFTLDASIGKSFRIANKYFLSLNLSVSNILDNKDIITGGYEQNRFDFETKNVSKFPSKYYYMYGRTFFLNLGFRF